MRETPSLLDGDDVKDLILEIAQKLLEHKTDIEPDRMDWIFHSASCRGAVKGGDHTSPQERELFVKKAAFHAGYQVLPPRQAGYD